MWSICRSGRSLWKKGIQNETGLPTVYNGKELDEMTGLYYYGARYMSPRESFFLGCDPLMEKYAFQSPFAYAANNPVNYIDWMGMGPFDPDGKYMRAVARGFNNAMSSICGSIENAFKFVDRMLDGDKEAIAQAHYTIEEVFCTPGGIDKVVEGSINGVEQSIKDFSGVMENGSSEQQVEAISEFGTHALVLYATGEVSGVLGGAAESSNTIIYRSISAGEAKSIQNLKGRFTFLEGQMEVKQFWLDDVGLNNFNSTNFAGEYNIKVVVPKRIIGDGRVINTSVQVDGFFGPTGTVSGTDNLRIFNENILNYNIIPVK